MIKDIKKNAKVVDDFLKKYFKKQKYSSLISPMKYGTLFGGKKIRSTIIINTSKIFGIELKKVKPIIIIVFIMEKKYIEIIIIFFMLILANILLVMQKSLIFI